MNPAWHKTQKGRVVYNSAAKPFSPSDAARVLRSVLDFDTDYDDDDQVYRLFYFLFDYGFQPLNITIEETKSRPGLSPEQQLIESIIYRAADAIGVPEVAQTFAALVGEELYRLVVPDQFNYALPSALIEIIKRARDTIEEEGRGKEWQLGRPEGTRSST